jgi:hypothetical protein
MVTTQSEPEVRTVRPNSGRQEEKLQPPDITPPKDHCGDKHLEEEWLISQGLDDRAHKALLMVADALRREGG